MSVSSIIFHATSGCSGIGKTPLACILAMTISEYAISNKDTDHQPGFKTTSHLDFLRGQAASLEYPIIFDDGHLQGLQVAAVKAFLDVAGEDCKVFSRYTATNLSQHQTRFVCTNSFDEGQEPSIAMGSFASTSTTISHNEFMRMFAPALPAGAFEEDIMAILKRTSIVLFANQKVFLRPPSEKHIPVQVIAYPHGEKDLLTQQCKDWQYT